MLRSSGQARACAPRRAKGRGGTAVSAIACWRIGLQAWLAALGNCQRRPSIHRTRQRPATGAICGAATRSRALPVRYQETRTETVPLDSGRQPAERVAVQVDHPAAAAGAPVDQLHVDAVARPAHGHGPAAPVADAERRTGRRVQAARVRAGGMRSRRPCSTSWRCRAPMPAAATAPLAGAGFGLGVAFSTDSARTGWSGFGPRLERATAAPGSRRSGPVTPARRSRSTAMARACLRRNRRPRRDGIRRDPGRRGWLGDERWLPSRPSA